MHNFQERQSDSMTETEAQEVVRLHAQRLDIAHRISISDVAEAIHASESDVRLLLEEVRRTKDGETQSPYVTQKPRSRNVLIAASCILIILVLMGFGMTMRKRSVAEERQEVIVTTHRDQFFGTQ